MSESSSPVTPVFVAHPLCPPHLRKVGEDAVEAFDSAWLLPPQAGEVFESAKACLRRLQGYALSRGFAVVTTASVKDRARFACIHHGAETKNWRELEDHVEKDAEGSILTRRKGRILLLTRSTVPGKSIGQCDPLASEVQGL
jgi:hypothetical protein